MRLDKYYCLVILPEIIVNLFGIFLTVGYQAAIGTTDASGNVLGFNNPLSLGHLKLMFDLFSFTKILADISLVALAAIIVKVSAVASSLRMNTKSVFLDCAALHSILFTLNALGYVIWIAASGPHFTGESIIEGGLSSVMIEAVWLFTWVPVISLIPFLKHNAESVG